MINELKSCRQVSSVRSSQQGIALLTILLLVVAITIVAGSMLASQKVMIRQYELTKHQGDFKEYALMGEAQAVELITQDNQVNQIDSQKDSWAKPIADIPIDGGKITLKIDDESSRFNINNLYHDGKVDTQSVDFLKLLLQNNGISPNVAMAILDWQDPDSDASPDGGAEADFYQSNIKAMPIPISNQPFISIDELQYVRGMDKEKFEKIRPFLTAVPFYLPMNVNTVKPELLAVLPMLATLSKPPSPAAVGSSAAASAVASTVAPTDTIKASGDSSAILAWAQTRENQNPIQSMTQFWALPMFSQLTMGQNADPNAFFDVQSRAFQVSVSVNVDDKQSFLTSHIAKIIPRTASNATPNTNNPTNNSQGSQQTTPKIFAYNRQFLPFALTP